MNESQLLDHGLRLTPDQEIIAEALLEELSTQKFFKAARLETWNILCANLIYAGQGYRLAVPMSPNSWKKKERYCCIGPSVIQDIQLLAEHDYIGLFPGNEKLERCTRIHARKKFAMQFLTNESTKWVDYFPPDFVVLKKTTIEYRDYEDPKTGKSKKRKIVKKVPINYKDTRETIKIRNILRENYFVNKAYRIQLHDPQYGAMNLVSALHASFTNDFKHGGRFYTSTECGYQQQESSLRPYIRINEQPTTELDFSALSIHMLYAMKGKQLEGDPYTQVLEGADVTEDELKILRKYFKKVLQAALNAGSEGAAVSSANFELFDTWFDGDSDDDESECGEPKVGGREIKKLLDSVGLDGKSIIEKFKQVHKPISEYFGSGIGLELQKKDSQIALRVINHFSKKRLPVLSIHDSFIVQERHRDELAMVMEQSYKAVMGEKFTCPIK